MEKTKVYAVVAIVVVIIAAVGVVYLLTPKGDNEEPETTVTDALGRTVNIPQQIDSIYCIGACSLRLVSYFDAVEKPALKKLNSSPLSDIIINYNETLNYIRNDLKFGIPSLLEI